MSAIGFLQVKATTSRARLPLENVSVRVVAEDGALLALRLTDSSGNTEPIKLEVPARADSQTPDPEQQPFIQLSIYARAEDYSQIQVQNVQVFAGTTTVQELNFIPLSELPGQWNETEIFNTPIQDL